jgi:predicted ATP-binding protein involved in virulence
MRITQIAVKKLFGMYDHTIPLNQDDRITIMHGPNGTGKTTLLRLANDVFKGDFSILTAIPFAEIHILFTDDSTLRIVKRQAEENSSPLIFLDFFYENYKQEIEHAVWRSHPFVAREVLSDRIDGINAFISSSLDAPEFTQRLGRVFRLDAVTLPTWLQSLRQSIPIYLIETQRLLNLSPESHDPRSAGNNPRKWEETVTFLSRDLVRSMQKKLAESAALTQELDRTFPMRLVRNGIHGHLTERDLRAKLDNLEGQRQRLAHAGLLDSAQSQDDVLLDQRSFDESTQAVLAVYLEDTQKKLAIFDELYNKINALQTIINKRFINKQMIIDKEQGFVFETSDGTHLEPSTLSSGEQHELILFYELLFRVPAGSLILIDEPEISLHVAWQVEFLRDLQEVVRLADIDILLATHSPQIINERWDLTVELKGTAVEAVSE